MQHYLNRFRTGWVSREQNIITKTKLVVEFGKKNLVNLNRIIAFFLN
jgi:hypothetical protein